MLSPTHPRSPARKSRVDLLVRTALCGAMFGLLGQPALAAPVLLTDPPQVVKLFGSYLDASGKFITSFSAGGGLDFKIVDNTGAPVAKPDGAGSLGGGDEASGGQPPLLGRAAVDVKEIVTDPVSAGSGSEEIWRKYRARQ